LNAEKQPGWKEWAADAAKKEEYVLPSLNARMLVDLMNDFYQQPGVEEAYQQWLAERRQKRSASGKKERMPHDHLP